MTWLARREYASRELHNKLLRQGCAEPLAAQVVERLRAEGLVSDDRYVEALIRARRGRGYGPLRILKELEEKGVAPEIVARWLDINDRSWQQDAIRVRRRKFGAARPVDYTQRARQMRFLQYRGFTSDQIRRALGAREDDESR